MTLPGPALRLWRDRPRVVAVALLAITAVAASALQTTAATVLQQTLDENWRGTYDILVTQQGKDPVTAGLLSSDRLVDASIGRMSLADLALIRSLPGVEVAAPVALVSFAAADLLGSPVLWVPVPVRADASLQSPQAFRVTVASETDDGVFERELASQSLLAFAYQPSYSQIVFDSSGAPLVGADGRTVYATTELADSPRLLSGDSRVSFTSGSYDAASGTIPLGLVLAPRPAANIALVDPQAERQLLGDAGAFLDPLLDLTGDRMPVVVLDRAPPVLRVSVTVEQFDEVTPGAAGADAVELAQGTGFLQNGQIAPTIADGTPTTVVGSYQADASEVIDPFVAGELLFGGLSSTLVTDTLALSPSRPASSPRSVLGPRYLVADDAAATGQPVALSPRGYASFGRFVEAPVSNGAPVGSVTEYSKLFGSVGSSTAPAVALPDLVEVAGSFSVDELRSLVGETSFMPLGAYDLETPTGFGTSLTGFGVPGTNGIAIGGFELLDGWNVERPISAIRIRVAGIDGYTPEAQQRLLTAASGLERLGFEATIVAGSSQQSLDVLVQDYALAQTDESGVQLLGDVGPIQQRWSRLGAVTEADAAVSATSLALLAVCVVAVGVLLSVVQLGAIPARRSQAGVLRQLGWRRRRIARWFVAEELVALAIVAIVGAASVLLSTVPMVAAAAVGVALLLVVATSLVGVLAGARAPRRTSRVQRARASDHRPRVTGPASFGVLQARSQPVNSASLALAALLVVVSIAIAAAVFVQGRELAGPSALGAVASARAWVPQGLLAAISLGAAVLLAVLSRRMGLERRREQWGAIDAMGWSRRDVARARVAEVAVTAGPGVLAGLVFAVVVAMGVAGS
ncbi:hypothetical protein BH10ACT7_BH10ACT7_26220 [soil metagenome]